MAIIDRISGCKVERDTLEDNAYILTFRFGGATTTIRIVLDDRQSGADMVITNMTTLPEADQRRGFGTQALKILLQFASESGIKYILAVQVQRESEPFWKKNGFVKLRNRTNDFQYVPPS